MEKNINLTVSQSDGTTSETATISTNNVEEVRKFLDQLEAACGSQEVVVQPEQYKPYGDNPFVSHEDLERLLGVQKTYEADRTRDVTIDKDGNLSIDDEDGDEDMQLDEGFGKSMSAFLDDMRDIISHDHDGKINPRTVFSAASQVAPDYADASGMTVDNATGVLFTLMAEQEEGVDVGDLADVAPDVPEIGMDELPPDLPSTEGPIPVPSTPTGPHPMLDHQMMEAGIMDYMKSAGKFVGDKVDQFMGAGPFPLKYIQRNGSGEVRSEYDISTPYDLELVLSHLGYGKKFKEIIASMKAGQDYNLGGITFAPNREADESIEEDADYDYRDEDNGPADPNSYDRNREISDFGRKGHTRQQLRRGGKGDNTLPDTTDRMFEEYETFKKKALSEGPFSGSPKQQTMTRLSRLDPKELKRIASGNSPDSAVAAEILANRKGFNNTDKATYPSTGHDENGDPIGHSPKPLPPRRVRRAFDK